MMNSDIYTDNICSLVSFVTKIKVGDSCRYFQVVYK